MNVCKGDRK